MAAPQLKPAATTALCLSGGGYRSIAFHTGVLWRLNEIGLLAALGCISSTSGGAILAGRLAAAWPDLGFRCGIATSFVEAVVQPVKRLMSVTISWPAGLLGLLPGRSANGEIARFLREFLYGGIDLGELPSHPEFIFCATDLRSGSLWRFSKAQMGNLRTGWFDTSTVALADAVAAAASFPPYFAPARLDLRPHGPVRGGEDLNVPPFTTSAILSDGGDYDTLALQPLFEKFSTLLISDASLKLAVQIKPSANWLSQILRVLEISLNQDRAQRIHNALEKFDQFRHVTGAASGAFFGLSANFAHYKVKNLTGFDLDIGERLGAVPTKFNRLDEQTQNELINWGYVICDAGIRRNFLHRNDPPPVLPYPES